jgi:protein arginine N-methyltransferase 1
VYFPIAEPVPIQPGDVIGVRMRLMPEEGLFAWDVTVPATAARPARTFRQSTLEGMLLDPSDLRRTRPDHTPALSPRGVARLTVLTLCDGDRSLGEIESGVYERHSDLFATAADAAKFVAEVVIPYSTDG